MGKLKGIIKDLTVTHNALKKCWWIQNECHDPPAKAMR